MGGGGGGVAQISWELRWHFMIYWLIVVIWLSLRFLSFCLSDMYICKFSYCLLLLQDPHTVKFYQLGMKYPLIEEKSNIASSSSSSSSSSSKNLKYLSAHRLFVGFY